MKDSFLGHNKWIQSLADKLFDKENYFVFHPWCQRIGHLIIEILTAASVAKRDDKKLVLISHFRAVNRAIFYCNFNCEVYRTKDMKVWLLQSLLNLSGFFSWFYNRIRTKAVKYIPFISKVFPDIFFYPRIGIEKGRWQMHRIKGTEYYWDYKLIRSQKVKASLNAQQLEKTKELRKKIGLPENEWFICLHVRESGYLGPYPHHNHRDSNILNYLPAIQFITGKGGYVVRMGDSSMTPIPKMEKVIDYALSEFRSDLMDLFLVSNCKFFLGCDSGPHAFPWIFRKPLCCINSADTSFFWSISEFDVIVPKHVFSVEKDRILSFQELINSDIYNEDLPTDKYIFIENTPEEILNTVKDFIKLLEEKNINDWNKSLQEDIKNTIRERYKYFISQPWVDDGKKEYWEARLNGEGLIGRYYLEKCWDISAYLEGLTLKFKEKSKLSCNDFLKSKPQKN